VDIRLKDIFDTKREVQNLMTPDDTESLFDKEIKPSTLNWVAIVASLIGIILFILVYQICYNNLWQ
jgi:hypothetical protein